jgi:hypothetical protein
LKRSRNAQTLGARIDEVPLNLAATDERGDLADEFRILVQALQAK